jgi:hypothetical protein
MKRSVRRHGHEIGRIHPANELLAHELVGKLSLGLDPDDPQRWG